MTDISLTYSKEKSLAGCDVSLRRHRSGLPRLALHCAGTQVILHKGFSCTLDRHTCSQAPSLAICRLMHLHGAHIICNNFESATSGYYVFHNLFWAEYLSNIMRCEAVSRQ